MLPEIHLLLDEDVSGLTITVVLWPADVPPPGTGPLPEGVHPVFFVEVTVSDGDPVDTATFFIVLGPEDVEALGFGVLVHFIDGVWTFEDGLGLVETPEGDYEGAPEGSCCSAFAVAFDTMPPEVTLMLDTPSVSLDAAGRPAAESLTATALVTDNLGVSHVEFFLDGQLQATGAAGPWRFTLEPSGLSSGEHTVRAVAYNVAGHSGFDEQTFTAAAAVAPDDGGRVAPEDDRHTSGWLNLLLVLGLLALLAAIIVSVVLGVRKRRGDP